MHGFLEAIALVSGFEELGKVYEVQSLRIQLHGDPNLKFGQESAVFLLSKYAAQCPLDPIGDKEFPLVRFQLEGTFPLVHPAVSCMLKLTSEYSDCQI